MNAYTVVQSNGEPNGMSSIAIKCMGKVFFKTAHRGVTSAFLASFHTPGCTPTTSTDAEFICSTTPEKAPPVPDTLLDLQCTSSSAAETKVAPHNYLCVLHQEELKDEHGRYIIGQCHTTCTSYRIPDLRVTHLVLHNIQPASTVAGIHGVFIHGERQTDRWGQLFTPLQIEGEVLHPAADLWWMASPLVVKPVYVYGCAEGNCVMGGDELSQVKSQQPTRSCTPSPRGREAWPSLQTAVPGPNYNKFSANSAPLYTLKAQVVGQYRAFGSSDERSVAVALTSSGELGLAVTKLFYQLDVLLWEWTPHRLHIPHLSANPVTLSLTVVEHDTLHAHVLFVSDVSLMQIHVVRAPSFHPEENEDDDPLSRVKMNMQLLFTLRDTSFPVVLSCSRQSSPQFVMVCNYPTENNVTLYDPVSLLYHPTAASYVASLPLKPCAVPLLSTPDLESSTMMSMDSDACSISSSPSTPIASAVLPSTAAPRIDGISFGSGSAVAFIYHQSSVTHTGGGGVANWRESGGRRRRRCETDAEQLVLFPSLQKEKHSLLGYLLDTLEAALGPERVRSLERELLRQSWEAKKNGVPWDATQAGHVLLVDLFSASLNSGVEEVASAPGALKDTPPRDLFPDPKLSAFCMDPSMLTASTVDAFHHQLRENYYIASDLNVAQAAKKQARAHGRSLEWPATLCGVAAFSLHLLHESCKVQERLWPLLEPLAELVLQLCKLLGWNEYVDYYIVADRYPTHLKLLFERLPAFRADSLNSSRPEWAFSTLIDRRVLQQCHFTLLPSANAMVTSPASSFAGAAHGALTKFSGTPPSFFNILQRLLHKAPARHDEGLSWPLLNSPLLDEAHPLCMANRLYCLFRDCFGTPCAAELPNPPWWQSMCHGLVRHGIPARAVEQELSIGVAYPILLAIRMGRNNPPVDGDDTLYAMVGRFDRVSSQAVLKSLNCPGADVVRMAEERAIGRQNRVTLVEDDGVMMRPDFLKTWMDTRLDVASAFFNTAIPIALCGQGHPVDELKELAKRTCALPVGRGMLTLCTQNFKMRDSIPIPLLNLHGRTSDGILVTNNLAKYQTDSLMWPLFHNGCAAGLRFLPLASGACKRRSSTTVCGGNTASPSPAPMAAHWGQEGGDHSEDGFHMQALPLISRHWVVYQTRGVSCPHSRAGLLLAAGILGHLTVLEKTDIFSLLAFPQVHFEAITIAVMLGLSCSFRGTNNDVVFCCLSMHVQSLILSDEEIEVALDVQTSALVSIGLLCQNTATNSFLVEMFLTEMSRLPSDEHCTHREGYALAAGFGLGLQLLGMGGGQLGIPGVDDQLFKFLEGARREPPPAAREGLDTFNELNRDATGYFLTRALLMQTVKDSCRSSSMRVYEGAFYNVGISGPAAAMALGLIYLKTDCAFVANRLRPPNRFAGIQAISPLLCMLRTMMANLILWSSLYPSREELYKTVPSCLVGLNPQSGAALGLARQQVHYMMLNLGYCVAGATMALALRYAGSMDADAHAVTLAELQGFIKGFIGSSKLPIPPMQTSTGIYEPCIATCCIAVALVMAGSGDLKIFSIFRRLQRRNANSYGLCMAISMAVGLLFLGGGHMTLSTSTPSVAALLLAFYPVWPHDPEDNMRHLQAFRHLYGLAVVPRIIQTVDAVSGRPVSVPLRVILRKGGRVCQEQGRAGAAATWTPIPRVREEQELRLQTPCLYPPPDMIERIEVCSTQHYPRTVSHEVDSITEYGLTVRILERRGSGEAVPKDWVGWQLSTAAGVNVNEQRLLDAMRRLFGPQRASASEALTILENIKLVLTAQRILLRFVNPVVDHHELISLDFGRAIEQALQQRYQFLFGHVSRVAGSHSIAQKNTVHPLHLLLCQKRSWEEVSCGIVQRATGMREFPWDFTSLGLSQDKTCQAVDSALGAGLDKKADSSRQRFADATEVKRWITEAFHFYFDIAGGLQELRATFSRCCATAQPTHGRMQLLLQLNQSLLIPLSSLEKLLDCCI